MADTRSLMSFISKIEDPRIERHKKHKLSDILMSALCAVLAGAEGWLAITQWARSHESWLQKFLDFQNGIPSHDTYARVISLIDPEVFAESLYGWAKAIFESSKTEGDQVVIDGKSLRGSVNALRGKDALSMVSAWVVEQNLVLGQTRVEEGSNEVTAVPKLLEILNLKGMLVSLDALSCRTDVAQAIHDQGGDWLLALKANQKNFHHRVRRIFNRPNKNQFKEVAFDSFETVDKGHGRIETRRYYQLAADHFPEAEDWKGLKTVGYVESIREIGSKRTVEKRYYVSSLPLNAQRFGRHVRNHWTIENNLHWCLDMSMGEDASLIRQENAVENFATLRRMALSILNRDSSGLSLKQKRRKANSDTAYLSEIIQTTEI